MDAAALFAKNFATITFEDLPAIAVDATKRQILDMIGVMLGGSSREGVKELAELVAEWGGKPESTVLGYGCKVPAPNAAQVNASMGHALDYDDLGDGPTHPSVVIVPACLAAAELKGKMSGKEFITAVALGTDMMCRLGASFRQGLKELPANGHPGAGWHLTPLYGFIASACAAAKIIGLNEEGIANALGIGYHQAAGNGQCVVDGSLTKRMGPGFAARGGLTSAMMARKGITGAKNSLEGECGLYPLYHGGKYNPTALTEGLGEVFRGIKVQAKPYPCCKGTHEFADVALDMVEKYKFNPEEITEITVYAHGQANLALPVEVKAHPRNLVDSQFSIPWVVAASISRKRAGIADFTDQAIHSQDILDMAALIKVDMDTIGKTRIKVVTKDGKEYSGQSSESDAAQAPVPFSTYERKFRDCVSYSVKKMDEKSVSDLIERLENLEKSPDVTEVIGLLG